jgi:hypothetical protein
VSVAAPPPAAPSGGTSALSLAAKSGDAAAVGALLAGGASVAHRDSNKLTPLHFAALARSADVATLLLGAGADPTALDANGFTPADVASRVGADDVAVLLVAAAGAGGARAASRGATWSADLPPVPPILKRCWKQLLALVLLLVVVVAVAAGVAANKGQGGAAAPPPANAGGTAPPVAIASAGPSPAAGYAVGGDITKLAFTITWPSVYPINPTIVVAAITGLDSTVRSLKRDVASLARLTTITAAVLRDLRNEPAAFRQDFDFSSRVNQISDGPRALRERAAQQVVTSPPVSSIDMSFDVINFGYCPYTDIVCKRQQAANLTSPALLKIAFASFLRDFIAFPGIGDCAACVPPMTLNDITITQKSVPFTGTATATASATATATATATAAYLCDAGQYNPTGGSKSSCVTCAAGTFSALGASSCEPCPPSKSSLSGSTSIEACKTVQYMTYSPVGALPNIGEPYMLAVNEVAFFSSQPGPEYENNMNYFKLIQPPPSLCVIFTINSVSTEINRDAVYGYEGGAGIWLGSYMLSVYDDPVAFGGSTGLSGEFGKQPEQALQVADRQLLVHLKTDFSGTRSGVRFHASSQTC